MKEAHIKVTGSVQGVFYRAHCQKKADELDLTGYAQNMSDKSVRVVVQGPEEKIKTFIDWCHEGSPSSTVEKVDIRWIAADKTYTDFKIF